MESKGKAALGVGRQRLILVCVFVCVSFLHKRNGFWGIPSRSVRLFFTIPSQKERRSLFETAPKGILRE